MTNEKLTNMPVVPVEAQAALDRAQGHWDAGNLAAALRECDQALQAAPRWAEAHNLRGIVLDQMGRTDKAVGAYHEALRLDPTLADAAENLKELQAERARPWPLWKLWKRIAAVALPVVVVAAVVVAVGGPEAKRGPNWRLTLDEYIAQSHEGLTVQSTATASHPASFVPAMGTLVPGGVLWEGINPVFPPRAVQCVMLGTSVGGGRQVATAPRVSREVVYVAYHSDGLYHIGWRVYEGPHSPFAAELAADLQTIGCDLPLE
jgi:hypothetical protein